MKKYHYTECGLHKVYLANGYEEIETEYGKAVRIHDPRGLHQAIAKSLCQRSHLAGASFRFLRKEMDLSQSGVGKLLGVGDQAVAKWEKTGRVPKTADRMIRLIYLGKLDGNVQVNDVITRISDMDRREYDTMLFEETEAKWQLKAA